MTMPVNVNTKILLSGAAIFAAAALIIGATFAFFSDTETSEGNVLQAGSLDLKIDSEAHYAGLICQGNPTVWADDPAVQDSTSRSELLGQPCVGTWELKDLEEGDTFVNLTDLKPGDRGENTISLHVFDNDAWGRIRVFNIADKDVDCTEPETESSDAECSVFPSPLPSPDVNGEILENLSFSVWLDDGSTPGFQCANPVSPSPEPTPTPCDPGEGDNIRQEGEEEFDSEAIQVEDEVLIDLTSVLVDAAGIAGCDGDGHTNYGPCHGLALDGRLVGSATYYFGVAWQFNSDAGNEAQTDSLTADISFEIVQHRNNPSPVFPTPSP